jgi:acyl-CoA hydrolase
MTPQQPDGLLRALLQEARRRDIRLTLLLADLTGSFPFLDENDAADVASGRVTLVSLAGGIPRRWAGAVDHLPLSLWDVDRTLAAGGLAVDVVVVIVTPGLRPGSVSLGDMVGYMPSALAGDSAVGFEVRPGRTFPGCPGVPLDRADVIVETDGPPLATTRPRGGGGPAQEAIGRHVAALIPDGATLQLGLGSIPGAVAKNLGGKRELGLHSGILAASLRPLIDSGVVTGRRKNVERGKHVATGLLDGAAPGSYWDWGDGVELQPISLTHAPDRLLRHERLWAVNSAFEVDLAGQVNAEYAGGARIASGGGQVDFVRAAHASPGGAAVIALPARTKDGRSRIVARLSPPAASTSPASDIDFVVTEHGIARLAGRTASERAQAMVAVAHPDDRVELRSRLQDGR